MRLEIFEMFRTIYSTNAEAYSGKQFVGGDRKNLSSNIGTVVQLYTYKQNRLHSIQRYILLNRTTPQEIG